MKARPLGCGYREELVTLPNVERLFDPARVQAALPCRGFAQDDALGYPVHPIKRLFESDQVRAGSDIRPVLMGVIDMTQPAEVLDLIFTRNVFQFPAAPQNLTTRAMVARCRPRLLLILVDGSLPGRG